MGTSPWAPLLGNLYLGTSIREPRGMGFGAAPLCSETFTIAEDPSSLRCWGKKSFPSCFSGKHQQFQKHMAPQQRRRSAAAVGTWRWCDTFGVSCDTFGVSCRPKGLGDGYVLLDILLLDTVLFNSPLYIYIYICMYI